MLCSEVEIMLTAACKSTFDRRVVTTDVGHTSRHRGCGSRAKLKRPLQASFAWTTSR